MSDYISREAALSAQNKSMNLNEMRERLERIPAADVRAKWISVEERLPVPDVPVLVTYIGCNSHKPFANMLAYIDSDFGWCWWDDAPPTGIKCKVEITHWMPLPEPPKEE